MAKSTGHLRKVRWPDKLYRLWHFLFREPGAVIDDVASRRIHRGQRGREGGSTSSNIERNGVGRQGSESLRRFFLQDAVRHPRTSEEDLVRTSRVGHG
ncbi:hypothetical protein RvY_13416-2 [Ramazzottius varieornatus]|uniref:Uncharacterized protein n=1 Tax=Ramazzottius varieornatus TaxID=947166 RepID=A0A1D1VVA0_RAMVA|nr:hypothetical protein RvY_13416-2 [Ramazzottius varieornatus]